MNLFVFKLFLFCVCFYFTKGIRNGEKIFQTDARFIASIRLRRLEQQTIGSGFLCTAALINNRHAVTAATCVTKFLVSELQIVMGIEDISTRNSRAVTRDIQRMHFHPSFNRTSESNEFNGNVAVIQLSISIRQSTSRWSIFEYSSSRNFHIQPIRINDMVLDLSTNCKFFSWSKDVDSSERIPYLLSTTLAITNNYECLSSDSIFCAHNQNDTKPVLCGNLGGALICDHTFYGVATRDVCDEIGHFVLLPFYNQWISAVSGSNILTINNIYGIFLVTTLVLIK